MLRYYLNLSQQPANTLSLKITSQSFPAYILNELYFLTIDITTNIKEIINMKQELDMIIIESCN